MIICNVAGWAGLGWPLLDELNDTALEDLLSQTIPRTGPRFISNFVEIYNELQSRKNVTINLLWQEYKEKHLDGYQYSWFCSSYREWVYEHLRIK